MKTFGASRLELVLNPGELSCHTEERSINVSKPISELQILLHRIPHYLNILLFVCHNHEIQCAL